MKIHITKQGESLETIANSYAVSRQDLTGINPHVNLASELVPGLKLKIPDASRVEKDHHIEKFYPNLDHHHNQYMKEQAVPIGLKPFDEQHTLAQHPPVTHPQHPHPEGVALPEHHVPEHHGTPWGHLGSQTTHLTHESMPHYPWNYPPAPLPFIPPQDAHARALIAPLPPYGAYPPFPVAPYPPYGYPPYGYGVPLPIPVPGFAPGYGFGGGHGWHGPGHGWHGGGGHGWHGGGHHR